jgi:intracellular multiplication protein IcmK
MDKKRIKKITIAFALIFLSGSQYVYADTTNGVPPTNVPAGNFPSQNTAATPAAISEALAQSSRTSASYGQTQVQSTMTPPNNLPIAPGQSISRSHETVSDPQIFNQLSTTQRMPANGSMNPVATTTTTTTTNDQAPPLPKMEPMIQITPPSGDNYGGGYKNYHNYKTRGSAVISPSMTFEQSQQAMLNSAPPVNIAQAPDADAAFNALMQQNLPLSPQQVVRLRQLIDVSQRAASIPATIPPKPVSTTLMINLAPGTTPPAIRLAQGYVSSLVFVDSTGAPWPIAAYDIGDPKTANIQWDTKGNIMLIQATSPYSNSDIVIRLIGLMTPITLELVSGQRVVDYRTDIHVSGLGPNSKDLPTGTPLPASANQLLLGVLDGIAPPGSKLLSVKGGDCQAWLMGDTMYLRTRLTVLSPGWVGRMVSPDGMYAYEIQRSSSVLVSQYGEPIELKIGGF